jgi:hypothetical protein
MKYFRFGLLFTLCLGFLSAGHTAAQSQARTLRPDIAVSVLFRAELPPAAQRESGFSSAAVTDWSVGGGTNVADYEGTVLIANAGEVAADKTSVTVTLRFKVGDFEGDPIEEVTDYDRGYRTAKWQPPFYTTTLEVGPLEPGSYETHRVLVDMEKVRKRYGGDNWPWFAELSATATVPQGETRTENNRGAFLLSLVAGD